MPTAYDRAGRPAPTEIRLHSAEKTLDVDFADGRRFSFPAELLRVESPSAEVQGHAPDQKVLVAGRRHVNIIGIDPVGAYGVALRFDDLHDTGIYTWEYFYNLGLVQDQVWAEYLHNMDAKGLSRDP